MRRTISFALLALSCLIASSQVWAEPPAADTPPVVLPENQPIKSSWVYPLVLAAGAVAGVAAVNTLTYGVGTIPYWVGITTTAPIISPASAAASRIFVITSGVIGLWIADSLYNVYNHYN
jgi:hypothetical protein